MIGFLWCLVIGHRWTPTFVSGTQWCPRCGSYRPTLTAGQS